MHKHKSKRWLHLVSAVFVCMALTFAGPVPKVAAANFSGDCKASLSPDHCGIVAYIELLINVLSALTGIVIVIMIVVGGIQYTISADNAQQTEQARERIRNAIIALMGFIFTYAFLQYVIPGGLF